ncbi:hypothetical protein QKT49_gp191 [Acanthamoeba castellanii medusavirus]|uniref:Uncharacterized protein n=1 Tax=Acanthamoeba castellanii medusavirus J1 TaxID=3114988 RepID=A0A3T1CXK5_9VIRU|nr:hypothetical protein QKT49_gp191 [Acanthamoeba castellanii medusavirus]BBI30572.1 hypothetical protein [Acanthamoeba castellanii medusavirus J1]
MSTKNLTQRAAEIIGKRRLTLDTLREIAEQFDIKVLDGATKRDIGDELEAALRDRKVASELAKALIEAHEALKLKQREKRQSLELPKKSESTEKKKKKKVGVAKRRSRSLSRDELDDLVEALAPGAAVAIAAPKKQKKSKKQTKEKLSNQLEADPATGYLFGDGPRTNMINADDGGSLASWTNKASPKMSWVKVPASVVLFATEVTVPEPLSTDASILGHPVTFVMRPEALVYGRGFGEKLPCLGPKLTGRELKLVDLSNAERARDTLSVAVPALVKNLNLKKEADLVKYLKSISVQLESEADADKLKELLNRLGMLFSAPEIINSSIAGMWAFSMADLIVRAAPDSPDGALVTAHFGPELKPVQFILLRSDVAEAATADPAPGSVFASCDRVQEWMANYNQNKEGEAVDGAWRVLNLCPSGLCLQPADIKLRNGLTVHTAVMPALVPLYSMDLAASAPFKRNSGVVPFWFQPAELKPFAAKIRQIIIDREAAKAAEATRVAEVVRQSIQKTSAKRLVPAKDDLVVKSAPRVKAEASTEVLFASLTKAPLTLLDLRMPIGDDAKNADKVRLAKDRITATLAALSGGSNSAFSDWMGDRFVAATQTIGDSGNFKFIASLLASVLPEKMPKGKRPPSGWVSTVADPADPAKSYHVVHLLDEDAAGWQVRNWLSEQSDTLTQRMAAAADLYATKSTGTASLSVVRRLTTQSFAKNLDQLAIEPRLVGQQNPKLLWNGPLAAYRERIETLDSYQSVASVVSPAATFRVTTVPAGVYMHLGVFGVDVSALKDKPEEVLARCRTAGFVAKYPRGGSLLYARATPEARGFDWAWAETRAELRMLNLSTMEDFTKGFLPLLGGLKAAQLPWGQAGSGWPSLDALEALIDVVTSMSKKLTKESFGAMATALIAQGRKSAFQQIPTGEECYRPEFASPAIPESMAEVSDSYLRSFDYAGSIERLVSYVSRYYGLHLDGWYSSIALERTSSANSVVFGLTGKDVLQQKFFHLGSRAPGGGMLTWHVITHSEETKPEFDFAVPATVATRARKLVTKSA